MVVGAASAARSAGLPCSGGWNAPAPARRGAGFTLLELIVALAIVGLLMAALPFAVSRAYESAEYRSTVRNLLAGLKTARLEALRTGQAVAFVVDLGERRFGMADRPGEPLPERLTIRMLAADNEVENEGRGSIRFFPNGSSSGGMIDVLRPSGDGVRLRVDWLFGRITQEVPG
ncbi:MAG: GspH/FimT family pseudopilin [Burkholderiaceae bacterium]